MSMEYSDQIHKCYNIYDIIDVCHESISQQYKPKPWTHPELNHGVDLLSSDESLNCYMSAYGYMHTTKCRAAMMNFPFQQLIGNIEIVDWGCGQGIGAATIVDVLKQHELLRWLRKVTLVEPSEKALNRAVMNVKQLTQNNVEIDAKNKFLPSDSIDRERVVSPVGFRYANVIHVFSNVLDISTIDLGAVAYMVASAHGRHFVLCIGPKNSASYRIERFCSIFGNQEYFSKIDSVCFGRTNRTAHPFTCMTRCFKYNGAPLDLERQSLIEESHDDVYNEYDLRLQIQNNVLSRQKARVAWRLENLLSVDDIMYIDAVVNEVVVDFIIVRPNKGILLINVFEENLDDFGPLDEKKIISKNTDCQYQSPISLIDICQTNIKDGIEELLISTIESSRNFSLIKKVIVFTGSPVSKVKEFFNVTSNKIKYTYIYGEEFINDRNVSLNLYGDIGFLQNNEAFDDIVKRKLAEIISPSWHSYQEGRVGMHPIGVQKKLSESSITQQKISGVAGSGKTQVLAFRAINAMKRTGGDVLVLTYNITLANYLKLRLSEIREDFSWEKIDIYPYHQFFRIRATECGLPVEFGSYEDENFFSNVNDHKRYSAIFIDEVQDYTTEWLHIVMRNFLLDSNGEIAVFGDPKQNVYQRPLDANGDICLGVIGGQWNRQLTVCRRFTNPRLAKLAMDFQAQFMPNQSTDDITTDCCIENTFNFQILNYIDMRSNCTLDALIGNIINIILNDNNEARDFVVLAFSTNLLRNIDVLYRQQTSENTETTFISEEKLEWIKNIHKVTDIKNADWKFKRDFEGLERIRKQLFTTDKRCLKLSTIQSFKGWESPSVIFILENGFALKGTASPMSPQIIYTAITRARENIYIINIGDSFYHDFFKSQSL